MTDINKGVRQRVADAASQIAGNYCRSACPSRTVGDDVADYPHIQPQSKPLTEQLQLFVALNTK